MHAHRAERRHGSLEDQSERDQYVEGDAFHGGDYKYCDRTGKSTDP